MKYKILEELSQKTIFGSNLIFLCFLHMRNDLLEFLTSLENAGGLKKNIYLTGPTYSFQDDIIGKLSKEYKIIKPEKNYLNIKKLINLAESNIKGDSEIIIIEDGGHIVPFLHKNENQILNRCIGAVEQTTRGINLDQEITKLKIPIGSIPGCDLKQIEESPHIALAARRNIESIMNDNNDMLPGKKVGIIGFGSIGSGLAEKLKHDCHVHIADKSFKKLLRARLSGYDTEGSIIDMVKKLDIVIGTTGSCTIKKDELVNCKDNIYLASTSSRQVEIDIGSLKTIAKLKDKKPFYSIYERSDGVKINLLYDGHPVNFAMGFSLPEPVADMIYSLIFNSIDKLITSNWQPKIHQDMIDEELISKLFIKNYLD